jgi:hypothetical protein
MIWGIDLSPIRILTCTIETSLINEELSLSLATPYFLRNESPPTRRTDPLCEYRARPLGPSHS